MIHVDLIERNGAMIGANQNRLTAKTAEPFHDVLRIGDAAAKQEQLRLGGG